MTNPLKPDAEKAHVPSDQWDVKPSQWDGSERRGLPFHIIRYMDERLEEQDNAHNSRFEALNDKIDLLADRFSNLSMSLTSWTTKEPQIILEKCEKLIDEAIPHHPENPNATPSEKRHEHRRAHASWIKKVDDEMKRWALIRQEMVKWVLLGSMSVTAIAVWQYLLRGPQ